MARKKALNPNDGRLKANRNKRVKLRKNSLQNQTLRARTPKSIPTSIPTQTLDKAIENSRSFELTAGRIAEAVTELNLALKEALANQEMRAEVFTTEEPGQFAYRVYRLTHALYTWQIRDVPAVEGQTEFWQGEYKPVAKPLVASSSKLLQVTTAD